MMRINFRARTLSLAVLVAAGVALIPSQASAAPKVVSATNAYSVVTCSVQLIKTDKNGLATIRVTANARPAGLQNAFKNAETAVYCHIYADETNGDPTYSNGFFGKQTINQTDVVLLPLAMVDIVCAGSETIQKSGASSENGTCSHI